MIMQNNHSVTKKPMLSKSSLYFEILKKKIMFLRGIAVVCLAIVHLRLIHARKAEAYGEVLKALNLNRRDVEGIEVPQIIFPEQSEESIARNGRAMRIRAFDDDYSLYLRPRDPVLISDETSVYRVRRNADKSGGVEYELIENAMKKVGRLLEDRRHRSSVVLSTNEYNDTIVTAVVVPENSTSSVVIRTLPKETGESSRKRRSIHDADDYSSSPEGYIAVKLKNQFSAKYGDNEVRAKRDAPENKEDFVDTAKAQPNYPSALYPKLLVAADSTYYHNTSDAALVQTLEYFMALINGVDLSYRHLENPTVNLHIAAITIATTPSATPYIANNLLDNRPGYNTSKAIEDMTTYFHNVKDQISVKYDIALSFSKNTNNFLHAHYRQASVCGNSSDKVDAVAHFIDNGRFGVTDLVVFALGNIFGLQEQKVLNVSIGCRSTFYDPADADCENGTASIMTQTSPRLPVGATFSEKSLREFDKLLEDGDLNCMYEKPAIKGNILPGLMPGKMIGLVDQCKSSYYNYGPHPEDEYDVCGRLSCTGRNSTGHTVRKLTRGHSPAPGTPCKRRDNPNLGVCLEKRCVGL